MFKWLFRLVLLVLMIPAAALLGVLLLRVGPPARIAMTTDRPGIGRATKLTVKVTEPARGLGNIRVDVIQGSFTKTLASKAHTPRRFWALWGPRQASDELLVTLGRQATPELRPGQAVVRVSVERAGTWLRRPAPAEEELALPVRFVPPSLTRVSNDVYLAQGGSEAVVYRVGETSVRDGVQAGDWFFPGYPLPGGGAQDRMAFMAMPHTLTAVSSVRLVATDELGNEARLPCVDTFIPRSFKKDTIPLTEAFLSKVVSEVLPRTPELAERGTLLDNYLMLNREVRKANAQRLLQLSAESRPEILWRGAFARVEGSAVRASFGDRRTYSYEGQPVDQQDHLGIDMASVRHAKVVAANDGLVAAAEYLGIYGNAIVIDHGCGLMSLYGHLSSIGVQPGEKVQRGQEIGRTGDTGLAAGDHLHFAILLDGLPVSPMEWWDEHWVKNRIALKLGAALPATRPSRAPSAP